MTEDPHGLETYGFRGWNSGGKPRSHINIRVSSCHEYNMSLDHLQKLESIKVWKDVRMMSGICFLDHRSKMLSPRFKNQAWIWWKCWKVQERFISHGFSQKEGIYYDDIFAPVAQYTTIRSITALAVMQGWSLHQMMWRPHFCMVR